MYQYQVEIYKLIAANVLPQPFEIQHGMPQWNSEGLSIHFGCSLDIADKMYNDFISRIPALAEIMRHDPTVFCLETDES
jgi:hypothetical protein